MASLRDRVRLLEARAQSNATALLDEGAAKRLARWPELILERYAEGRLDDLAASLPALGALLIQLERAGAAIQSHHHWHPLYRVDDPITTERVMARLEAQGDDFAAEALAHLPTKATTP